MDTGRLSTPNLGAADFSADEMLQIFDQLRDYVAIHAVELDDSGTVIDTRLAAWNRAYGEVRLGRVEVGQSILTTYVDPHHAMLFVNRAWREGSVHEVFEFTPETRGVYSPSDGVVMLDVHWQRIGDYVVEIGTDLSELRLLQMRLADQESVAAQALRARVAAEARERIARDLHDSVLQQLFASALQLGVVAESDHLGEHEATVRDVAKALTDAIAEIRHGINDLDREVPLTLARDIEDAARFVAAAAGVDVLVAADDLELDSEVRSNLRLVVREAASNAVRHGNCSRIHISIIRDGDDLVARIEDDGIGIGNEVVREGGIRNMRVRAERLGGTMALGPGSEGGTLAVWRVPFRQHSSR